ncbi:MAG: hypothetical protein AB7W37_06520 [Syntrophobacteraceae bacterium]
MLSAKINSMMGFLVQSGLMDSAEGREIACPLIAEMEDACKMALRMERMQVGIEAITGRIEGCGHVVEKAIYDVDAVLARCEAPYA